MADQYDPLFDAEAPAPESAPMDFADEPETEFLPARGVEGVSAGDDKGTAPAMVETGEEEGGRPRGLGVGDPRRSTTKYMTKYERARILGTRALQLRCAARQSGLSTHSSPFYAPLTAVFSHHDHNLPRCVVL